MPNEEPKHSRAFIITEILRLLRLGIAGMIEISQISRSSVSIASAFVAELIDEGLLENAEEQMGLPAFRITKKGLVVLSRIENTAENIPGGSVNEILNKFRPITLNVGHVVVTKRVAEYALQSRKFALYVQLSLERYRTGDWGDIVNIEDEWEAVSPGNKTYEFASFTPISFSQPWILSLELPEIWIYTTEDHSITVVMFAYEYDDIEWIEPYWGEQTEIDKTA